MSFTKKKSLRMSRFRVRKNPDPLLKFTQKTVLFQDISIFFVLKTELYLSSGTYFFFWKLVFHFTFIFVKSVKTHRYANQKTKPGSQRGTGPLYNRDLFGCPFLQTGNFTVTVVPSPTELSRLILAPWIRAECLTIESPSPVPPTSLEWLLSTR